jgi:hypothetical protein
MKSKLISFVSSTLAWAVGGLGPNTANSAEDDSKRKDLPEHRALSVADTLTRPVSALLRFEDVARGSIR